MAGRDKKVWRLPSLRALFDDAGGSIQRPIADPGSLWAAAELSGLTRCKSVFVARNQPADRALATMEKCSSEEP
jgi:hypothetical protein